MLIVEDGTGVTDANTWTNVAFADAYFLERAVMDWGSQVAAKETALIKATDYIHTRFGSIWKYVDPDLVDPAVPYTFGGTIPKALKKAQCEYALRAMTAALLPDPTIGDAGVTVVITKEVIGSIETEYKVVGSGYAYMFRPYPAADILLGQLLVPTYGRTYR